MNKIYLDNNSTTAVDPRIMDKMIPLFTEKFGNPSSKTHSFGWEAEAYVEKARKQISKLINSNSSEIIFTSGATESNNLAIQNIMKNSKKPHMITLQTEHKAVLDICKNLQKKNIEVTYIKPNNDGITSIENIEKNIKDNTKMISIMHANNEIGVIQPIEKIAKLCETHKILFHIDAAQSLGKIKIDLKNINVDFLSLSSHKIYGPKGVGCLYINNKIKKINSIIWGGNQERGLRPGTLPVPLIVGFGEACNILLNVMVKENKHILNLRNQLLDEIKMNIPDVVVNGNLKKRIAGNLNLSFPSLRGQSILPLLPNIAISSGSACTSSSPSPSHVLTSIGLNKKLANSSIRIGIGRFNTKSEIKMAAKEIINAIKSKSK